MHKKGIFIVGLIGIIAASCTKHEIIPAPTPSVDLKCSFQGDIGGAFVEYTENVDNYTCFPSIAKQTLSGITNAQYLFSMSSTSQIQSVQIAMGSLSWSDPTGTQTPALTLFNSFFTANDMPNYSDLALAGFEVTYRDATGLYWKSDEASPLAQTVAFNPNTIKQESDASGDYSLFTCDFACPVYHTYVVVDISVIPQTTPPTMRDSVASILIENAIYKGYFKR